VLAWFGDDLPDPRFFQPRDCFDDFVGKTRALAGWSGQWE